MGIVDKTGRNIHQGQLVDICLMGLYPGEIVRVQDNAIVVPGPDGMNHSLKFVTVQVLIQIPVNPRGMCEPIYIVKSAPKSDDNIIAFPKQESVESGDNTDPA